MTAYIRYPILFRGKGPSRTYVEQTEIGPRLASPALPYIPLIQSEACPKTRTDIFDKGCEIDPYCPGLWIAESKFHAEPSERAFYLRVGVQTSAMAWRKYEETNSLHWWEDIGTRPMLRALYDCAVANKLIGEKADQAIDCLEYLLEMDPEDHLGAQVALDAMTCSHASGWHPSPHM